MILIITIAIFATSIIGLFFLGGETCNEKIAAEDKNEATRHANASLDEDDEDDFMLNGAMYRRNMSHFNRYVVGHGGLGSVGRF